ncbi:MAG TPA: hypothetical protein VNS57_13915 [Steroidobacteraceae bacterium]|nr:hypothetical protein [Steroidobacteraceae bacterium]
MLPTPSFRPLLLAGLALALAGCSTSNPCRLDNAEYLQAQERPRLQLPEGVSGSERLAGSVLVIPPVAPDADKLDPAPRCLDEPPGYFRRVPGPGAGATAGSPEEAVNVWAMAWASRKADQVASFYSPAFETTEAGGAAAYIEGRREQVASGPSPEPRLEDLKVTSRGDDRSVVTFVQNFGSTEVRKELTLVRDAQGWRIVAERTL